MSKRPVKKLSTRKKLLWKLTSICGSIRPEIGKSGISTPNSSSRIRAQRKSGMAQKPPPPPPPPPSPPPAAKLDADHRGGRSQHHRDQRRQRRQFERSLQ